MSNEGAASSPLEHVIVRGNTSGFLQQIESGPHRFMADEPVSIGGTNAAPDPYDYLLAGLGACTSMTVNLYAKRKGWPLENVTVALSHLRMHAKDCAECETKNGMLDRIEMEVTLDGPLTETQRTLLMEAAQRCPVHRTLKSEIKIDVRRAPDAGASTAAAGAA